MLKFLGVAAAASVIVGCATSSLAGQSAPGVSHHAQYDEGTPLSCSVRAIAVRGGVRLQALVSANHSLRGTYDLQLSKSGPSGSSDISQGGEFAVSSGQTEILSGSEISLERGARLSAKLTLTSRNGSIVCDADFDV